MIDPKNMSTWPVVFIEKDDIEAIMALDGFSYWFRSGGVVPDNCFGFNEKALVVYARGDKETIADYCFGNVRRFNKALQNEIEVVKRENNKLMDVSKNLEIENERLRKYKADLSPVVDKYNNLVRENVKLESAVAGHEKNSDNFVKQIKLLQMMLDNSQSGNTCKASDDLRAENLKLVRENEMLKIKVTELGKLAQNFDYDKAELCKKLEYYTAENANMAKFIKNGPSEIKDHQLAKENWKLHNEAILLREQIKNLENQKKCMVENFRIKLSEKSISHENEIKNLNNTIIRLRNDDGNHLVRSLQKGIERLKAKVAGYQNEVYSLREQRKVLHGKIESMEREINRLKPFEGSYDRWQLENRVLQERLEAIKKSLSGFAGKI
jgi:predicted  nucleic acid-binding Zn-ribbon protein